MRRRSANVYLSLSTWHVSTRTSILNSAIFRSFNAKVAALAGFGILALSGLAWIHELYIQFILVVWNVAIVLFIVVWEKEKSRRQSLQLDYTQDGRWCGAKKELEDIDNRISKIRDLSKKKELENRRKFLVNELRRLEWSIRESNINEMYNAQNGRMKKFGPELRNRKVRSFEEIDEENERLERKESEYLKNLIANLQPILKNEPVNSLPSVLKSIINEIRAHYNLLKQNNPDSGSLANCWAVWALLSSAVEGTRPSGDLSKYASKQFGPQIDSLANILEKRGMLRGKDALSMDTHDD